MPESPFICAAMLRHMPQVSLLLHNSAVETSRECFFFTGLKLKTCCYSQRSSVLVFFVHINIDISFFVPFCEAFYQTCIILNRNQQFALALHKTGRETKGEKLLFKPRGTQLWSPEGQYPACFTCFLPQIYLI